MLEAAKLACTYVSGKSKDDFLRDTQCQDAVVHRLVIIGEAARHVSEETRSSLSGLPWAAIVGMRNLMIHEYDAVDLEAVWDTVQNNLIPLIKAIEPHVPPREAGT
jgi:uncharacterized protein with HEPN domain